MNFNTISIRPADLLLQMLLFFTLNACSKTGDPYQGTTPATPSIPAVPTTPANPPVTPPTAFPTNGKTYLALGDSYTIGQSVATEDRFPYQTARMLIADGTPVNEPKIIATTGWTTGNLLSALNANPPATNYDIVTLLIGVNNQYQGRPLAEYRTDFALLLNKAIGYASNNKNHVFVLSIPDYSVTPFASGSDSARIAMEIDQFNAANKEITLAAGVKYIDITPISREGATDGTLHATDGLHPSGKQYKRWSELLEPTIKAAL